jgi:hypothetical protein
MTWAQRARHAVIPLVIAATLWLAYGALGDLRRRFIASTTAAALVNDAPPRSGPRFPQAPGAPIAPVPPGAPVRVVLIDGAGAPTSRTMNHWNAVCARGLDLQLDVGFPTVSLPVQLALWSGRTQQQTGVLFHSGKPVVPPLAPPAIPPSVPGSIAIAESHPYIIQSLGFADARPPLGKKLPDGWAQRWVGEATTAVASTSPLVFVHILRVDTAGHKFGRRSGAWRTAAEGADAILGELLAAAPPTARWFVLADHDHIPGGGHGGEERSIRIVRGCIAGPGIAAGKGGPIHITDYARAIADSLGLTLAADSPGRPLDAALAAPVGDDDVLPRLPGPRAAAAWALVLLGVAITGAVAWSLRRAPRWQQLAAMPWWWPLAMLALLALAGAPTLSTPMIYKPKGLDMAQAFAPGLALLGVGLALAARGGAWARGAIGQLALPALGTLAVLVACGGESLLWGGAPCPVVPLWTAWLSALLLMLSAGAAVAALVLLATAVLSAFDPSGPSGTRRSDRAAS